MRSLIQSDVSNLESDQGLPAEGIFGSGGQPRTASPSAPPTTTAAKTLKKCKRIHDKKKRRRCVKRVKARGRARLS
jgi:hypothetical protein